MVMQPEFLPDPEQDEVFVQEYIRTRDAMIAATRAQIRDPRYAMEVTARRTLERLAYAVIAAQDIDTPPEPVSITRETILANSQDVYEKALTAGDFGACNTTLKLQANILGLISQRQTVDVKVDLASTLDRAKQRLTAWQRPTLAGDVIEVPDIDEAWGGGSHPVDALPTPPSRNASKVH